MKWKVKNLVKIHDNHLLMEFSLARVGLFHYTKVPLHKHPSHIWSIFWYIPIHLPSGGQHQQPIRMLANPLVGNSNSQM